MLSVSVYDPSFNGGQPVVTPAAGPGATSQNTAAAVAIQKDGKIVVVGTITPTTDQQVSPELAVRRYNANGTLDTTFGTAGEVDIADPAGATGTPTASANVVIQPDGKIVFSGSYSGLETVVVRLTTTGALDTTFGTGGEAVIGTSQAQLTRVAVQADNKLVLGGIAFPTSGSTDGQEAVTRLNADGSVDSSFHGGTLLTFDPATYGPLVFNETIGALVVTPAQKIALGWRIAGTGSNTVAEVVQLNADGTLDASFGSGGVYRGPGSATAGVGAAAVQPDGKIVIASDSLVRLNANGTVDATFAAKPFSTIYGISSVAVQADGRIVVGGIGSNGTVNPVFALVRYSSTGMTDGSYGPSGQTKYQVAGSTIPRATIGDSVTGLALASGGQVVAVGTVLYSVQGVGRGNSGAYTGTQAVVAQLKISRPVAGDYDNDGKSDIAAQLASLAEFAVRKSTGGDVLQRFGAAGIGQTIPVSGDYDGDGVTDVAVYIPAQGVFAYRPSSGGSDVVVPFGTAGTGPGQTIFAPGDYDGDGISDLAVYLPASGSFAVRLSTGVESVTQFGAAGAGASIPAPGDYDGDGRTDLAVYLTTPGVLAYRPSSGGNQSDVLSQFGTAGAGGSIPVPGDYDGDGKTDVAVYLPASGSFAVQPSSRNGSTAKPSYIAQFGLMGRYQSVPAPGDYDGDGITDLAVYLPTLGKFAYRPSSGGADVIQGFGAAGLGQTVPASSIPYAQPTTVASTGSQASAFLPAVAAEVPLPEDLISALAGSSLPRRKAAGQLA